MPFEIPTLPALVARAQTDLQAAGVDGALRRSDAEVLARVHAGGVAALYGLMGWIAQQILPDTADVDMLARWASLKNVARTPATRAAGEIAVSGADATLIPQGFLWQTASGARIIVTHDTLVSAGAVPVEAEDYGRDGNLGVGAAVSAVSPLAGLADDAVVSAALAGGTDEEDLESWRRRVVESFRMIPHGGSARDYVMWALQVPGVTRAWCLPQRSGIGTVDLFFVRDEDDPITPDGSARQVVQDHLDAVRPVTSDVNVLAPSLLPVDVTIAIMPDTVAIRERVATSLRRLFMDASDLGQRMYRSHFSQAISNTAGETDHTLIAPAADIVPADNELPVLGVITWQ